MDRIEIRTMVEKIKLEDNPKISFKVRDYVWSYIFENLLKPKKILIDNKYSYRITLTLEKYNPDKHKYSTDSPFNTSSTKFRPEPKFNTQGSLKFALVGVVSDKLSSDISPTDYANIIYDAFGAFLIVISKKVTKEEFDELKNKLDYNYINSLPHPATIDECRFFLY